MAYEQVKVSLPDSVSEYKNKALMVLLGAAIVALLAYFFSLGVSICVLVAGVVVAMVFWGKSNNEVKSALRNAVNNHGVIFDFDLGAMGIDTKNRKAVFFSGGNGYDVYDLADILGWEHQWVNKTSTEKGAFGVARSTTRRAENVLVFKTNNPQKPIYKVGLRSHADGEVWMARLSAIING